MANFAYLNKFSLLGFPLFVPPVRLSSSPILAGDRDVIYVTDEYTAYTKIKMGAPRTPSRAYRV